MTGENFGDTIEVKTSSESFKGILLEDSDKGIIRLKLPSGYNIGVNRKKVKNVEVLKKAHKKNQLPSKKNTIKKGLKTVSILHTGGTIASKVDYNTGAVTSRFTPEEIIGMFPEIKDIVNIRSSLLANMASDDMRFAHYNMIAEEIKKEVMKGVDGIIITHGTDTLHYTSAALSFILEDLSVPVIIVGAQRSSDRGSSDAAMNLICACKFIAETDFAEVAVCMHKSISDDISVILPGTKVRKMHTSRRDAFKAVNSEPWAEISYKPLKIVSMKGGYRKREDKPIRLMPIREKLRIGIIVSHPNMFASEIRAYEDYNGVILEGTGLGHFPISVMDNFTSEHKRIFAAIKKLAKKMPVVMSPQTVFGRIQMNVYSSGRLIQEAGVVGNYSDMTPETAFVKLAWLLSNCPEDVKEKMLENLRGELSLRTGVKGYLD